MPRRIDVVLPMLLAAALLTEVPAHANSITATSPAPNEKSAPRATNIAATADATIDGATVTQSTYRVQGEQTGRIAGTYSTVGATFHLDPTNNLKPGEMMRVTATSGIESTTDIALTPHVWQFTAAAGIGTGVMTAHPTTPSFGGQETWDVMLGDVDGDGDLDAIVVNQYALDETVWLNDGDGNFTAHSTFDAGWYNRTMALGDIDGDGDLDAVLSGSDATAVMLNNGTGTFSAHPTTPVFGGTTQGVSLGDLDGDGDLDAIAAVFAGPETVWLNDGAGSFSAHPTPSFGAGDSHGVALGDLDADGDLDVVVASAGDGADPETVWLNGGSGVFSAHPTTPSLGAGHSFEALLGDLDGDGDLDLVVINDPEAETVWLNDGTGSFTTHPTPTFGPARTLGGALGDLDGDGDLDVVTVDPNNDQQVWLNDGSGAFSAHPTVPNFGGGLGDSVALGDLDGDGDLDAVIGIYGAAETVWLNGLPAGITVTPTSLAATSESGLTRTFTVVLDSQPIDDVSIQIQTSDVTEARVSSDGVTQQTSVTITFTSANWNTPKTITVHGQNDDVDDGNVGYTITTAAAVSPDPLYSGFDAANVSGTNTDNDTAGVTRTPTAVSVSESGTTDDFTVVLDTEPVGDVVVTLTSTDTGEATITPVQLTFTTSDWSTPKGITVTGVDDAIDDGDQVTTIELTMNTGSTFDPIYDAIEPPDVTVTTVDDEALIIIATNPVTNAKAASRTTNIAATADAAVDGATVTQSTFRIQGEQTGRIAGTHSATGATFHLDPTSNLKPGDMIRVTATSGIESTTNIALTLHVWQFTAAAGIGTGVMTAHPTTPNFGGQETWDVMLGDVDGDGDLDAIVVNQYALDETVWLNDGDGNFTLHSTFDAGWYNNKMALGDIDGDGDLDALVSGSDAVAVMLNNGTGTFTAHPTTPVFGGTTQAVSLGDLDGDGDLDAIAAVFAGPETVWRNDGTGNFSAHPTPSFGAGDSHGLAFGDLDADGDLDVVVASGGDNFDPETVWLNDGSGVFSAHPTTPSIGAGNSFDALLGDLDGDGDLDLVVINDGQAETVWRNDGTGGFSAHPTTPTFGPSRTLGGALGDLDGDGDLDVITVDPNNDQQVWLNNGSGAFSAHPTVPNFGSGPGASVALGDLDGDGDLDAVIGIYGAAETVWLNHDPAGVTVTPAAVTVSETGTTDTFTVVLDSAPTGNVVIDVSSGDTGEATVSTAQLTFTTANWSSAQTVTVTGVNDGLDDGDQNTTITVSMNVGATADVLYDAVDPADVTATTTDDDAPFGPPPGFSATATSATQVALSWGSVGDATSYEVYRTTSVSLAYTLVTSTANLFYADGGRTADTTYLYKVRTIGPGGPSAYTPVDAATTIVFTDPTLSSSIKVKRAHLIELRTAVNAMRSAAALSAATFTDPTITVAVTKVKRLHITELRTALDAARTAIGLGALTYTDPTITANSTMVKSAHFSELRAGTQ